MKVVFVGASSQIGCALQLLFSSQGVTCEYLDAPQVLNTSLAELNSRFKEREFQFVVNTFHADGFDAENSNQKELEKNHIHLPQQLAKLAESLQIPLLHVSDYHVFSGNKHAPYEEADSPHSQTLYGVTRWQGELAIQRSCQHHIILRVGAIFCEQGKNWLNILLEQWKKGRGKKLSTQLKFSPAPTQDIARVMFAVLQQLQCDIESFHAPTWGVYHYCSADVATPYDFAEVLLAAVNQYKNPIEIEAVETGLPKKQGERTKKTPFNTVLNCDKILSTFGIQQRPWRGELTRMAKGLVPDVVATEPSLDKHS